MIQLRPEKRTYTIKRQDMERDSAGNATQKTIWFDCPFCSAEIKARIWSLCGRGKRCRCEALFYSGGEARKLVTPSEARNVGVNFTLHETGGSRPGRVEIEVFAPEGYAFDGERHSMITRGGTLDEAREMAIADASSTRLIACKQDCDCNEID